MDADEVDEENRRRWMNLDDTRVAGTNADPDADENRLMWTKERRPESHDVVVVVVAVAVVACNKWAYR